MKSVQEGYDINVIVTSEDGSLLPLSRGDEMALRSEPAGFITFDLLPVQTPDLAATDPLHERYQDLKAAFAESDGRRTIELARQIIHRYPHHVNAHIYEAMGMGISGEHGLDMAIGKNRDTLGLISALMTGGISDTTPYESSWQAKHYLHALGIVLLNSADYERQSASLTEDPAKRLWHLGNARALLDMSSTAVSSPEMLLRRLLRRAWCEKEAGEHAQARETILAARAVPVDPARSEQILQKEALEYEGIIEMMRPEEMRGIA